MRTDIAGLFDENNYPGYAEKVAQVESDVYYFVKQANEEGYDLDGFTDDQIVEMASEWGDAQREGGVDEYDSEYIEGPENLGPKTAEADFLGRYMAHAMHDEQIKIAKDVGLLQRTGAAIADKARRAGSWLGEKAQEVGRKGYSDAGHAKMEAKKWMEVGSAPSKLTKGKTVGQAAVDESATTLDRVARKKDLAKAVAGRVARAEKIRGGLMMGGAGAAGLGTVGGAYALGRSGGKEVKSHIELLDEAAIDRANLWLDLAGQGYDFTFDKVASVSESDMDQVITELAWSKLQEAGYVR